jgi:hypothetical protein
MVVRWRRLLHKYDPECQGLDDCKDLESGGEGESEEDEAEKKDQNE